MAEYIVYRITNKVTGKSYVGFTSQGLKKRFYQHTCSKKPIGFAIRKYGKENFEISTLCVCETLESALKKEKSYILEYNTFGDDGYNCSSGGEHRAPEVSVKAYRTESFRKRMREQAIKQHNDPETKKHHVEGIRSYWKNIDENTRNERAIVARANGKKATTAWNKGMKLPGCGMAGAKNPMAKPYLIIFPDGKQEITSCLEEFCRNNGLISRCVYRVLEGKQAHHKGFRFARLEVKS